MTRVGICKSRLRPSSPQRQSADCPVRVPGALAAAPSSELAEDASSPRCCVGESSSTPEQLEHKSEMISGPCVLPTAHVITEDLWQWLEDSEGDSLQSAGLLHRISEGPEGEDASNVTCVSYGKCSSSSEGVDTLSLPRDESREIAQDLHRPCSVWIAEDGSEIASNSSGLTQELGFANFHLGGDEHGPVDEVPTTCVLPAEIGNVVHDPKGAVTSDVHNFENVKRGIQMGISIEVPGEGAERATAWSARPWCRENSQGSLRATQDTDLQDEEASSRHSCCTEHSDTAADTSWSNTGQPSEGRALIHKQTAGRRFAHLVLSLCGRQESHGKYVLPCAQSMHA